MLCLVQIDLLTPKDQCFPALTEALDLETKSSRIEVASSLYVGSGQNEVVYTVNHLRSCLKGWIEAS